MNSFANQHDFRTQFEAQTDDRLRELITHARGILAAREEKQKKDALAEIRRLARAHGLDIAVKKPSAKRGRPPKARPDA